jgi:hypothetical protein
MGADIVARGRVRLLALQGLKPLSSEKIDVAAEAATHKDSIQGPDKF